MLVRDGAPVFRANEGFTTAQLVPRHPRSAVGQTADGRVLLVAVDGRRPGYSVGMTNFELAQAMVRLGAVRAMALDGGGSTTLAFDGSVYNRPSDGRERPISSALMLSYSGVYAPPPAEQVQSPNGDGVAEEQTLRYKVVRPSTVTVTLTGPGERRRLPGVRGPGARRRSTCRSRRFRLLLRRLRRPHRLSRVSPRRLLPRLRRLRPRRSRDRPPRAVGRFASPPRTIRASPRRPCVGSGSTRRSGSSVCSRERSASLRAAGTRRSHGRRRVGRTSR